MKNNDNRNFNKYSSTMELFNTGIQNKNKNIV